MLETITLDQLRMLLAVVDEGSFSAAGRKLQRVQSAVSHAMASLEAELGVPLFERGKRGATLTRAGETIVAAARRVCAETDALRRIANGMTRGLEPAVALAVDALFPPAALVRVCREFAARYPTVELHVFTDTLTAVAERVRDGRSHLGVVGSAADTRGLTKRALTEVRMIPVAGRDHPLARVRGSLATEVLAEHVQLVLSERGTGSAPDQAVLSPRTWRIADLATKHAFLRAGLGWGNMPEDRVREDLRKKRLVRLRPTEWTDDTWRIVLFAVQRPELALGEASEWLLKRMGELCDEQARGS